VHKQRRAISFPMVNSSRAVMEGAEATCQRYSRRYCRYYIVWYVLVPQGGGRPLEQGPWGWTLHSPLQGRRPAGFRSATASTQGVYGSDVGALTQHISDEFLIP
jgi:hypothetical protein